MGIIVYAQTIWSAWSRKKERIIYLRLNALWMLAMIKNMDENELGSHHCTRENISYTIASLKEIEKDPELANSQDWPTQCGIYAKQMQWLLSHIDA